MVGQLVAQPLGRLDVGLGQLVADAPAAGVEHDPHVVALVEADLHEVVARAEGAELGQRPLGLTLREPGVGRVLAHPPVGLVGGVVVAPTDAGRHPRGDPVEQWVEAVGQVLGGDVELGGDHAAADVHADRRGDHGVPRGDDRADGGAHPDVGVGHQGDVTGDDRQARRGAGLLERAGLGVAGPAVERVGDLGGGHRRPLQVGGRVEQRGGRFLPAPSDYPRARAIGWWGMPLSLTKPSPSTTKPARS